jgi:diguanylate cyclase (GGDEF)-like protein
MSSLYATAAWQTDALTGAGSRAGLSSDLCSELHRLAHLKKRLEASFLCCDIDDFKTYIDYQGLSESDTALIELASCLKDSELDDYRFGGDEFVARGATTVLDGLMQHRGLTVRQTIVDINLPLDRSRLHRCHSWILAHLQLGVVQPKVIGDTIQCRPPEEWSA